MNSSAKNFLEKRKKSGGRIRPVNKKKRTIFGAFALVSFIILYSLLAMVLASYLIIESGIVVQIIYYASVGIAWIFPAVFIISWMNNTGS